MNNAVCIPADAFRIGWYTVVSFGSWKYCGIRSPLVPRVEKSDSLALSDFMRGQYSRT
ncbi:MAG: hypothetical protein K6F71_07865 [Ruminococcus sp.]|uniref:hypothetical protein n=1 Tax=Ruminococcus sp. TaxID=41978 RepID=UPI0025F48AAE|nr:hypothetical protein [Ruminococcus sp.]MCR5540713.1 hypothetical protein [Ruminococcus sp.]